MEPERREGQTHCRSVQAGGHRWHGLTAKCAQHRFRVTVENGRTAAHGTSLWSLYALIAWRWVQMRCADAAVHSPGEVLDEGSLWWRGGFSCDSSPDGGGLKGRVTLLFKARWFVYAGKCQNLVFIWVNGWLRGICFEWRSFWRRSPPGILCREAVRCQCSPFFCRFSSIFYCTGGLGIISVELHNSDDCQPFSHNLVKIKGVKRLLLTIDNQLNSDLHDEHNCAIPDI